MWHWTPVDEVAVSYQIEIQAPREITAEITAGTEGRREGWWKGRRK